MTKSPLPTTLSMTAVAASWWPLALSWLLMGVELPLISAVVARLPDQAIQLAAFGGVVFPLALLVEAPVIMMLAASTALCTNETAYRVLRRFMTRLAATMTALHILIAFTPMYDWCIVPLLDIPENVIEPSRLGLMIMTPWTWAIADRRFHQGLLIRFGHRSAVAIGTGVRLCTTITVLLCGWLIIEAQGVVVASSALTIGTLCEAGYARLRSRSVIQGKLRMAPIDTKIVRGRNLLRFYVPLALTPLLVLTMQPIGSAGIDRMPNALVSLAVWAPLNGLVFMCRSTGIAFNEVVISHCDDTHALSSLRRFAWLAGSLFTLALAAIALTPLGTFWFESVMGLDSDLVALATASLWIAILIPLLTFLQSLYQGILVHAHRTRAITESVVFFLAVTCTVLGIGIMMQPENGITVVLIALTFGNIAQAAWLWHRCQTLVFKPA